VHRTVCEMPFTTTRTDANLKGHYPIKGPAFVYLDRVALDGRSRHALGGGAAPGLIVSVPPIENLNMVLALRLTEAVEVALTTISRVGGGVSRCGVCCCDASM
jgi:hypothetical protein